MLHEQRSKIMTEPKKRTQSLSGCWWWFSSSHDIISFYLFFRTSPCHISPVRSAHICWTENTIWNNPLWGWSTFVYVTENFIIIANSERRKFSLFPLSPLRIHLRRESSWMMWRHLLPTPSGTRQIDFKWFQKRRAEVSRMHQKRNVP